jgi:uncharacterized protein
VEVAGDVEDVAAEEIEMQAMTASLPALGVGLGYRAPHFTDLFLNQREVDFLEVTADHFFDASAERAEQLQLLRDHFTLIPHGLNLSLGSAEGIDAGYLGQFSELVAEVNPPWWSEHIAFTRAGGIEIGHLTPLPFTREAVDVIVRNVADARQSISVPLILENITYTVTLPGQEMSEAEFLRRIVDATGCGLLLDVTNLFINSANHGHDPRRWLDEAPLDAVIQLHYVGAQREGDHWIDSHARPVGPGIWELLEEVLARAPVRGAILERDDDIPPLSGVLPELRTARNLGRKYKRWA